MARRFRAIIARDGGSMEDGDAFTTEDGRAFPAGAFTWRNPPCSMMGLTTNPEFGGHAGAALLGQMATLVRDGDLIVAEGTLNDEGEGDDADWRRDTIAAIERGDLNGVSVEPAGVDVHFECVEFDEEEGWCTREVVVFDSYVIGAACVVTIPAIDGTLIELLDDAPADEGDDDEEAAADAAAHVEADAVAASAALSLEHPPLSWFEFPEPDELTPFTITDDGQVFGHLASWDQCHIGIPNTCVTAWRSPTDYSYFHLCGPVQAQGADGLVPVQVGPVAGSGGHFPTQGEEARNWRAAAALYDDPVTCGAYVTAIDGVLGPFVRGALRHGATAEQVAFLRNHPPSGDWRRIGGQMELVGVCSVNMPGFPVRRVAMAASAAGELEPVAAVMGLGHRGRCDTCGGHETPPAAVASGSRTAHSTTAAAVAERLERMEATLATLAEAFEPEARERLRSRMRA